MQIRLAQPYDLNEILSIYDAARKFMFEVGNPHQWGTANPPVCRTKEDIAMQKLYVAVDDEILAVFFFDIGNDPTYAEIYDGQWLNDSPYGVIHRIAVADNARGKGVAGFCFNYAFSQCNNLKIDTHKDNIPMQKALCKHGFRKCGIIHFANGDERIAFQKIQ